MTKYIVKRAIMALVTILAVACVTSVLVISIPGSPFNGEKITPGQKAAMEAKCGMNDPLGIQVLRYLKGVIVDQGFDVSLKIQKDRPVLNIITEKFPLSTRTGVIASVWAVAVGIPLGCSAACNRGKWVDSVLRAVYTLGMSIPDSVVATFLLIPFCNNGVPFKFMGINVTFDTSQGVKTYLIPCLALGPYPMCCIVRLTRSSMPNILGQDYIKTVRARSLLAPRIIFKHVLRDGVTPVITYLGPLTAFTLVGGFMVETIYAISGLGRYLMQSVQNCNYLIIAGTTISLTTLVVIMNPVVDILYRVVDPRIDLTKGK